MQNPMLIHAESVLLSPEQHTGNNIHSAYSLIEKFKKHCIEAGYSQSQIEDACFFLCAFLDEQFSWDQCLVSTFCESDAHKDTEFFIRLERRQQDPKKYIDLLELAYFCLSLGFQGKFKHSTANNGVATIMDKLFSCIRNTRDETTPTLLIDTTEKKVKHWRYPPIWLTGIITLLILISIFISYNKQLNQYSTPVVNTLQKLVQADNNTDEN